MLKYILLLVTFSCSGFTPETQELLHLHIIEQEFKHTQDHQRYHACKEQLRNYYLSEKYELDVHTACKQAEKHFCSQPIQHNSLIIFDIDDTAIFNVFAAHETRFIWPTIDHLFVDGLKPALRAVLELYNSLHQLGYKIVFLSGRPVDRYDYTCKELNAAGYHTYEALILMPAHETDIPSWKHAVRKQLAEKYHIAGCIGDRSVDFMHGHTGYEVRLPNYIY